MKIMTLYITVFTQAAQWIQPIYLQHTCFYKIIWTLLFLFACASQVATCSMIFWLIFRIHFQIPPSLCATCLIHHTFLNMHINILTILEEAYNLGSFSSCSLLLINRGCFIVCLGYMRFLQKTHLICDYQSNKHWSNNRHDVCEEVGDSHHCASIIWGQINVIQLETHITSTIQSDTNCEQCHWCCRIFSADEVQSNQSQTGAAVCCDQCVNMGYMFLKYAEHLNQFML